MGKGFAKIKETISKRISGITKEKEATERLTRIVVGISAFLAFANITQQVNYLMKFVHKFYSGSNLVEFFTETLSPAQLLALTHVLGLHGQNLMVLSDALKKVLDVGQETPEDVAKESAQIINEWETMASKNPLFMQFVEEVTETIFTGLDGQDSDKNSKD